MKRKYWALEFTNDHAQVLWDWALAASAENAAKAKEREYGGIVYWVEGPFDNEAEASEYLNKFPGKHPIGTTVIDRSLGQGTIVRHLEHGYYGVKFPDAAFVLEFHRFEIDQMEVAHPAEAKIVVKQPKPAK